ncbi:MAG: translin family protein [Candidatus Thermoplasmatota archaeon]|nr:translin family protein [Candidatus Thermoplasmatota archaeon]
MNNLESVIARIEAELDEKDQIREIALKSSRAVVRLSGSVLKGLHRREDVTSPLSDLRDEASRLSSLLGEHPDLTRTGYVVTAFQEYAEVGIVMSLLERDDVPMPEELGVGSAPYLLALGDVVGELRRFALEELRRGNADQACHFLDRMEDLYHALIRFDYPDAIAAVKHKQDVARSLLEKTRGDVAVAVNARRLYDKLEQVLTKSNQG